jgi:hypothetical protein
MVYHGRVKNGTVVLDPGVKLPEGAVVRVELELAGEARASSGDDPLSRIAYLAVEAGIPDLATNVDHYLYGHPRASDAG